MEDKKFTMIDEPFICEVCGKKVEKLNYTARDHCNHCLSSKHLDINPGDRNSNCGGILIPISIEKGPKDKIKIIYKCFKCEEIKQNIMA
jgi:DNA-directed RNA polymerase subunit RPC12/RpoP